MVKAGQTAGQSGTTAKARVPFRQASITAPWTPRTDGKQALLVSERTTVFDRKLPPPESPVDRSPSRDLAGDQRAGCGRRPGALPAAQCRRHDLPAALADARGFVSLLGDAAARARRPALARRRRPRSRSPTGRGRSCSSGRRRSARCCRPWRSARAPGRRPHADRGSNMRVSKPTMSRWYISERKAARHAVGGRSPADRPGDLRALARAVRARRKIA
jgi:hypothetical protein